jgi:hypothetical protein
MGSKRGLRGAVTQFAESLLTHSTKEGVSPLLSWGFCWKSLTKLEISLADATYDQAIDGISYSVGKVPMRGGCLQVDPLLQ